MDFQLKESISDTSSDENLDDENDELVLSSSSMK